MKNNHRGTCFMPADALFLHHIANELSILENSRIDRIYMPTYDDVVLFLRAGDRNVRLLISCNSAAPRCCLAEKTGENPDTPFAFLMHLRKHLSGGIIEKIEQIPFERVLKIHITSTNNMFTAKNYILFVELVGKFSNIVLTDENGKISDSAKHLPLDVTARAVLPGLKYQLPPPQADKTEIGDRKYFSEKTAKLYASGGLRSFLQKNFIGFAPASIKEAVFRSGINNDALKLTVQEAGTVYDAFASLMNDVRPALLVSGGKYEGFYPSPYGSEPGEYEFFPSLSKALEAYYDSRTDKLLISARGKKLQLIVKQQLEHCSNNAAIFQRRIAENSENDEDRMTGDLIVSNIYKIKRGDESVEVDDYFTGKRRIIALDGRLSPSQNAARYYKKYEKAKNTVAMTEQLLEKNNEREDYLQSLSVSIDCAVTNADFDEIEREMAAEKLLRFAKSSGKNIKSGKPMVFDIDGYRVLIGKNNYQNDALVKKSQKNYMWLHTQKIHGSHAVIEGTDIPQDIINKAAALCAYYSKASDSANVPVDYTLIKYVKKPAGAAPGKVIYTNQQTVNVTPRRP